MLKINIAWNFEVMLQELTTLDCKHRFVLKFDLSLIIEHYINDQVFIST